MPRAYHRYPAEPHVAQSPPADYAGRWIVLKLGDILKNVYRLPTQSKHNTRRAGLGLWTPASRLLCRPVVLSLTAFPNSVTASV